MGKSAISKGLFSIGWIPLSTIAFISHPLLQRLSGKSAWQYWLGGWGFGEADRA